ncbi:unnamed protein product [Cochlearia groenlandica]
MGARTWALGHRHGRSGIKRLTSPRSHSAKFMARTKPNQSIIIWPRLLQRNKVKPSSLGHVSIKGTKPSPIFLWPCIHQTQEPKSFDLVPSAQRRKQKTSRRNQSSKPRCNYKEKTFHNELKAVQRSDRPKTTRKFKEEAREGKEVIMFGPKSHTQVCEEQTVKTKSKNLIKEHDKEKIKTGSNLRGSFVQSQNTRSQD